MATISQPRRQEGQGLVEFALIIPIFLLVLVGIFDAGRLVYTNSALSQAAREGARLAATEASWIGVPGSGCVADTSAITSANPGAHVCPTNVASFKSHVTTAVNRMAVSLGPLVAVHVSCNAGDTGDPAPTGEWTETVGGNGCDDGAGNPVGGTGDVVSVRIEYDYGAITPIVDSIIGPLSLSGSATMVIN
jgi:hypothetical protein